MIEEPSETVVVHNSDILYRKECNWVTDIPYTEPSNDEIKLLEGTYKPHEILEQEAQEQIYERTEFQKKRDIINKIKVVALDAMGEHPLAESCKFNQKKKNLLIAEMQKCIHEYLCDPESFDVRFNKVCIESIFVTNTEYSALPIYNY